MPELPDVEIDKQYLDATSLHRRIADVALSNDVVTGVSPQRLRDQLRGATLESTVRHGKHLFVQVGEQGWLRLHFGMTGRLEAFEHGDAPDHTALRVDFDDGRHLAYVSQRHLGEISWVDDVTGFVEDEDLGPDALADLDADQFADLLEGRRGSVKGALMDQGLLAGLGNIYTDETLFQAGIHPRSPVAALDENYVGRLYRELRDVVRTAIRQRADVAELPEHWLLPNREDGAPCPRCDGEIRKSKVSGRTTYHCTKHQVLAR